MSENQMEEKDLLVLPGTETEKVSEDSAGKNPDTAASPETDAPVQKEKKILIVALGGGGAKILVTLQALHPNADLSTLLLETDRESTRLDTGGEVMLISPNSWSANSFHGCGGNPMNGERAFARERAKITEKLSGYDFVVVCGCLGGGTAGGGVKILASILRNLPIPAVFLFSMPFSFESYTRRNRAAQCLSDLHDTTELLITLPNDLLFSTISPETPADLAFTQAAAELSETVFGITELFRSRKLIGPDYAEFSAALRKRKNTCAFGCGSASDRDGLNRCAMALENLLESPFLGGIDRLSSSNAVFLTMTGGKDLQIAEMKRTLENFSSLLPSGVQVASGVTIHPEFEGKVLLTALVIFYEYGIASDRPEFAQETLWSTIPETKDTASYEQGLLNLQSFSKGIFSGCAPVKYRDEDLDIPTFQRKGLMIDRGSTSK
ncbi:MAG: hypothetical protein J6S58_01720 [Lentisphaeria bacterium]|nr:hypothetical protein [Lentisphaeria bacterium]